ncbi:MAG TPA: low temperature requirement protein A [Micromonosporaceae bacterium]
MHIGEPRELLHETDEPGRATFLELFFDLVYVFALTQISARMIDDLSFDKGALRRIVASELAESLLLLLALWFLWSAVAWTTSRYDPRSLVIQALVVVALFGSMVMAVALPRAFSDQAQVFATAYVITRMSGPAILALALRGLERRRLKLRMLSWLGLAAVPWIAGSLVEGIPRGSLWTAALAIEYLAGRFGWPVPGLGRSLTPQWEIAGHHLAERYQQFFLIALGESILVIGLTFSSGGFSLGRTVAFVVAIAATVLVWRIYFYRAGQVLASAIAASPHPGRAGRSAADTHLVMVIGVVIMSVGNELDIDHAYTHTEPIWTGAILAGPALFLAARARFEYEVFGRVSTARIVGLVALVGLFPLLFSGALLEVALGEAAVLTGVAVADARRAKGAPPEAPKPPL